MPADIVDLHSVYYRTYCTSGLTPLMLRSENSEKICSIPLLHQQVINSHDTDWVTMMMTSSNTGPLWGETTCHRWIPLTKASDAELWCFLWSAPEQTVEQRSRRWWFEMPSWSLWHHCNDMGIILYYLCTHLDSYRVLVSRNDVNCLLKSGVILCMHPANERWRYNETSSLIGWVHIRNDLC